MCFYNRVPDGLMRHRHWILNLTLPYQKNLPFQDERLLMSTTPSHIFAYGILLKLILHFRRSFFGFLRVRYPEIGRREMGYGIIHEEALMRLPLHLTWRLPSLVY